MKWLKMIAFVLTFIFVGRTVRCLIDNTLMCSYSTEEYLTIDIEDDHAVVSSCKADATGKIVIPSNVNNIPVTMICDYAFENCTQIEEVFIPDSITEIGCCAFYHCKSLKQIELPEAVTEIRDFTYGHCYNLERVVLPNGIKRIGYCAFCRCDLLKSIEIPDSVTDIEENAFSECFSLESATLPCGISEVNNAVFYECESLKQIELPETVTEIRDFAFCNCCNLETIVLPSGLKRIGSCAFSDCELVEAVSLPDGITEIERGAFASCDSLVEVCVPESVKKIGRSAFEGCSNLSTISLPSDLVDIGYSAFSGTALTEVDLPESVRKIGRHCFLDCSGLDSVTLRNENCEVFDVPGTISNNYDADRDTYHGVIRGYDGSTAQTYANKYNYRFESLGDVPSSRLLLGDVDINGAVSVEDAQLTLNAYVKMMAGSTSGLTDQQVKAADVNEDGEISVDDAQNILLYYVKNTLSGTTTTWSTLISSKNHVNLNISGERSISWIQKDGEYLATIPETSGVLAARIERNLLYDDGEQLLDYGLDYNFWFSDDDMLIADTSLECYTINGYVISYHQLDISENDNEQYAYCLALLRDKPVKVIFAYESSGSARMIGYVDYQNNDSSTIDLQNTLPIQTGDRIYFLIPTYDYDGMYAGDCIVGYSMVVSDDLEVNKIRVTGGENIYISYRITYQDGTQAWTEVIRF